MNSRTEFQPLQPPARNARKPVDFSQSAFWENWKMENLKTEGVTAAAATLSPLDSSQSAAVDPEAYGIFHVFAFQWKAGTTEDQKDRAAKEIHAFQGAIPGLLETHAGANISPRNGGYTFGGIMRFKDKASLDAYAQHPQHLFLLSWLRPLIDAIELDVMI